MDNLYGLPSPDIFRIDDLLDFSNDDQIFSSSSSSSASSSSFPQETPFIPNFSSPSFYPPNSFPTTDFSHHDLCVPSDDVAQLEWLSQFVDDSFTDIPPDPYGANFTGIQSDTSSFPGKPRSKRSSRSPWTPASSAELSDSPATGKPTMIRQKKQQQNLAGDDTETGGGGRRCTHCLSEKTPQWRTGPMGPKTLCNACGVRYKSGRLVPEYRPAASPTFMLTQHSNSHRKVMELRRQKEMMRQQQMQQMHHHHHHHHQQQQQQHQSNFQSV